MFAVLKALLLGDTDYLSKTKSIIDDKTLDRLNSSQRSIWYVTSDLIDNA